MKHTGFSGALRGEWLWMLFVLCMRSWHILHFSAIGDDKSRQIHAAFNIEQGLGYVEKTVPSLNELTPHIEPLSMWPPGYSYLLCGVNTMVHDFLLSAYMLDLLLTLTLALCLMALSSLLMEPRGVNVWYYIFLGCSFVPFQLMTSSDLLAALLYTAGVTCMLYGFRRENSWFLWIAGALLIALTPIVRFAYAPLLMVLPVTGFLLYRKNRIYRPLLAGLIALIGGASLIVLSGSLPSTQIENNPYWVDNGKSWYPENLLYVDPFPAKSIFFIDSILQRLDGGIINSLQHPLSRIIWAALCLLSLWIVLELVFRAVRLLRLPGNLQTDSLFLLTFVTTLGTTSSFMIYLSLTWPGQVFGNTDYWTFVCETRYFAPAIVMFPAIILMGARWHQGWSVLGIVCATFAILYFSYRFADVEIRGRTEGTWNGEPVSLQQSCKFLEDYRKKHAGKILVYSAKGGKLVLNLSGCDILDSLGVDAEQIGQVLPDSVALLTDIVLKSDSGLVIEPINPGWVAVKKQR